jgi:protein-tyrosine phosphatase
VKQKLAELNVMDEVKHLGIKLLPGQEVRISDQILPQLKQGVKTYYLTLF